MRCLTLAIVLVWIICSPPYIKIKDPLTPGGERGPAIQEAPPENPEGPPPSGPVETV